MVPPRLQNADARGKVLHHRFATLVKRKVGSDGNRPAVTVTWGQPEPPPLSQARNLNIFRKLFRLLWKVSSEEPIASGVSDMGATLEATSASDAIASCMWLPVSTLAYTISTIRVVLWPSSL